MSYKNFEKKWLGKTVDYDRVYGYQCVDLIKQYLHELFGLRPGAWGNAVDYWTNTNGEILKKTDKIATNNVQAGDIVPLRGLHGNLYGHVGIATGNQSGDSLEILEQNGSTGSGSGKGGDVIRKRFVPKSRVYGVLRKKTPGHRYQHLVGKTVKLLSNSWRVYKENTDDVVGNVMKVPGADGLYIVRGVSKRHNRVLINSAALGNGISLPLADAAGNEYNDWKVI